MKNKNLWVWLALILICSLGLAISLSCDTDDDDEEDDDEDETDDDDNDDTTDDDDDTTDDDDDDTTDDDDDTTDDDDDDDWDFYYEDIVGLPPLGNAVVAGNLMGHDIVAVMAFIAINGTKFDSIEWDMLDGLPAGTYQFNIAEGNDFTGDENPNIMVLFGLTATGSFDSAYVGVSGTAQVDATGGLGDTFTGACTNVEFRPVNAMTGVIDWSGPKGFVVNFAADTTIIGLK